MTVKSPNPGVFYSNFAGHCDFLALSIAWNVFAASERTYTSGQGKKTFLKEKWRNGWEQRKEPWNSG